MSELQKTEIREIGGPTGGGERPLLVSDDQPLVDEVLRLAAAAGASIELAESAGAARAAWRTAPLVLVGTDAAADAVRLQLPHRSDLVVVGHEEDRAAYEHALTLGAERVMALPEHEQRLVDRIADALEGAGDPALTVCVVGGRGGAGASTTAAAIALTGMRMGFSPLLVDGDPLGGGIDLVVGGEDTSGLRWPDLANTRGRVNGTALREALPRVDELTVLSWDREEPLEISAAAMRTVFAAARRCSDLVVVDLPRRIDEAAVEALARSTVSLLVVPAEVRATAAAARVAALIGNHAADLRLLVRGPAPSGLPPEVVSQSLGLPLAGFIKAEPGLAEALDRGEPPAGRGRGPLADFCRSFLAGLQPTGRAA